MRKTLLPIIVALAFAAPQAHAFEAGDWYLKLGVHSVDPKSDNGTIANGTLDVEVDDSVRPSIMGEYFFTPNVGLEVLAALPFSHDIALDGATLAETKELPPTISLQYHFNTDGKVSPYLGAGVNFTWFYDEDTRGALDGADLELDNSWGAALHAGLDVKLESDWMLGFDLRWIDIDTDVSLDGAGIGTVEVDPVAYGFYVGRVF